jgi:hypothetical protein
MSKCQAKKYLAGGRCGGSNGSYVKGDTNGSQVSASFSAMLAARSQQDSALWSSQTPVKTNTQETPSNTQLIVLPAVQQKESANEQKKRDIDFILGGDFD